MKPKWHLPILMIAVLACLALVAGCGNDGAMSPGGSNDINTGALPYVADNYGDPFAVDSVLAPLAKTWKLKVDGDTATIGSDGGTLELQMRGFKSKFKVPKNAVRGDVLFSVEGLLCATPFGDVLLYDFGPDGLTFNVPCELEVDAGQLKDHTLLSLFWLNPANDRWEFQQQVEVNGHKLKFEINHFSKYGIS